MKKISLLVGLTFTLTAPVSAQTDTITIKKNFLGTTFRKDEKLLNTNKLEKLLKTDREASAEFRKSKGPAVAGFAFGFAGGFLIGYDLGRALGGGEPVDPAVLGVGAALIGLSIPFNLSAGKHIRESVRIYNEHHNKTVFNERVPNMYLTFSGNSFGLRLVF